MRLSASKVVISPESLDSARLCLIHGSNDAWSTYTKNVIKDELKKLGYTTSRVIDSTNFVDWDELINELQHIDLFAGKQVIDIHLHQLQLNSKASSALSSFENNISDNNFVVVQYSKSNSLYKYPWYKGWSNSNKNLVISCYDTTHSEFNAWVKSKAKSYDLRVSDSAIDFLSNNFDNNPSGLINIFEQVKNIYKDKESITDVDLINFVYKDNNSNVFSFINLLLRLEQDKCLTSLSELKESTPITLVLWSITREVRQLLEYLCTNDHSNLTKSFTSLSKPQQNALLKHLDSQSLKNILAKCAKADLAIKGVSLEHDPWRIISSACLEIMNCKSFTSLT